MSKHDDEDGNQKSGPDESAKTSGGGIPIKWIGIGIGGLFLIEIIVGVILVFTHKSTESPVLAKASSSPHASANPLGQIESSHENNLTTEHGVETTEHTSESVTEQTKEETNEPTNEPSNEPEIVHEDNALSNGTLSPTIPTELTTPKPHDLNSNEFPSLKLPDNGEIQVDIKDAKKLLDYISGQ